MSQHKQLLWQEVTFLDETKERLFRVPVKSVEVGKSQVDDNARLGAKLGLSVRARLVDDQERILFERSSGLP